MSGSTRYSTAMTYKRPFKQATNPMAAFGGIRYGRYGIDSIVWSNMGETCPVMIYKRNELPTYYWEPPPAEVTSRATRRAIYAIVAIVWVVFLVVILIGVELR